MGTDEPPELLTPAQTCRRLGISRSTLDRWARSGYLRPRTRLYSGARRYAADDVLGLRRSLERRA